jgi:hypothetical protein
MHLLALLTLSSPPPAVETSWMRSARYGVMVSYLPNPKIFAKAVESFQVDRFADQVAEAKADYVVFTMGQHWGNFSAPNRAYERYSGYPRGSRTSTRDLPVEIGKALRKRGIRLILYVEGRAPQWDRQAARGLSDEDPKKPASQAFTRKWGEVIAEWSKRYGTLVSGWWVDHCYVTEGWTDKKKPYGWASLAKAFRVGNPNSALAFNPGTRLDRAFKPMNAYQDYTAGEQRVWGATPQSHPAPRGIQWHLMTYLGTQWTKGDGPRFSNDVLIENVKRINDQGGIVTLDASIHSHGVITATHFAQLKALGQALER